MIMNRRVFRTCGVAAMVVAGVVGGATSASAASSSGAQAPAQLFTAQSSGDGGVVYFAAPGTATDKTAAESQIAAASGVDVGLGGPSSVKFSHGTTKSGAVAQPALSSSADLYSSGRTAMLGSQSRVTGQTHYKNSTGVLTQTVAYSGSGSLVSWDGANPQFAQYVGASMTWTVKGISVSVSIPPGASGSGSQATWAPAPVAHTYSVGISRSAGPTFSSHVDIYSAGYESDGSVQIGGSWYYVQGS